LAADILATLRQLLVCPCCQSALDWANNATCTGCGCIYRTIDDIPILLADDAGTDRHKRMQVESHDNHPTPNFEISRPLRTPRFYGWLTEERFRRSILGLEAVIPDASAIVVCAGSGMDAEFLARQGANVICADISLGAARRALERARRSKLRMLSVVADSEQLPLRDRSIDLAYVHDGLHHLQEPLVGLREMARVAKAAVSVNEPAKASLTALAVKAGVALEVEESGNRVARLSVTEITNELQGYGFRPLRPHRYGMYYTNRPGWLIRALSRPRLAPLAESALLALNRMAGRVGNKMTVQAVRD
jgi:SAM-dependent methyltransferase